jgi:hypothetical protein
MRGSPASLRPVVGVTTQRSVADLLRFLEPQLSGALGERATTAIVERAESLPLDPFRLVGFELPLSGATDECDLLLQLAPAVVLRRQFASLVGAAGGGDELRDLLTALSDPADVLFGAVADAWLEYDVGSGNGRRPSLFASPAARLEVALGLAHRLGAGGAEERALGRLIERFGQGDRVQQLGVMHGRPRRELRCVVSIGSRFQVKALASAGWPGDTAALAAVLDGYGASLELRSVAVGFAADGSLHAPVGVELHLPWKVDAEALLARLEADGIADPRACARVLGWHGHAVDRSGHALPPGFEALSEMTGGRFVGAVVRRIHHVKLTVAPGRPVTAKAYLGSGLRLLG